MATRMSRTATSGSIEEGQVSRSERSDSPLAADVSNGPDTTTIPPRWQVFGSTGTHLVQLTQNRADRREPWTYGDQLIQIAPLRAGRGVV